MIEIINKTHHNEYVDEIRKTLEIGLEYMKVKNAFVSVVIVDNKEIQKINKLYRKKDKPTDVISFAFEDNENTSPDFIRLLGEIYISIDKAKEQAKDYGHSEKREITYLSVHGLLHLLGYDHEKEEDKTIMRSLEEKILCKKEKKEKN